MGALGHLSKARHVAVGLSIAGTERARRVRRDRRRQSRGAVRHAGRRSSSPPAATRCGSPRTSTRTSATTAATARCARSPTTSARRPTSRPRHPTRLPTSTSTDEGYQTTIRIGDPDTDDHRPAPLHAVVHTARGAAVGAAVLEHRHPRRRRVRDRLLRGRGPRLRARRPALLRRLQRQPPPSATLEHGDGFYRATLEPLPDVHRDHDRRRDRRHDRPGRRSLTPPLPDRRDGPPARTGDRGRRARRARRRRACTCGRGGAVATRSTPAAPPTPPSAICHRPTRDGSPRAGVATSLVADDKLDEMATIEFVPPKGLQPWEGAVLLDEKLDDSTVQFWLSGLAGREAIEIDDSSDKVAIGSGRRRGELDAADAALLDGLIGTDGPYQTGKYDPAFADGVEGGRRRCRSSASPTADGGSGMAPGTSLKGAGWATLGLIVLGVVLVDVRQGGRLTCSSAFASWPMALVLGLLFPAVIAYIAYGVLLSGAQRPGIGAGVADRVVPALPARQRGAARRVGVEARPDPRVQRVGGGARRGGRVDRTRSTRRTSPSRCAISAMPALLAATSPSITSSHVAAQQERRLGGGGGGGGASVAEEAEAAAAPGEFTPPGSGRG